MISRRVILGVKIFIFWHLRFLFSFNLFFLSLNGGVEF